MALHDFLCDGSLRLRALEPSDAELLWEVENDTSQWQANGLSAPMSRHMLAEYAANYDADPIRARQIRLVAEIRQRDEYGLDENNLPAGLVDLYDIDPISRTAWIGIYILPAMRGRGLGTVAISLLIKYARQLLGIRQLGAKIAVSNASSARAFEKTGFTLAGTLPKWLRGPEGRCDLLLYVNCRED